MRYYRKIAIAMITAGLTACAGVGGEKEIPISEVPPAAIAAAAAKVGGLKIKSAEMGTFLIYGVKSGMSPFIAYPRLS